MKNRALCPFCLLITALAGLGLLILSDFSSRLLAQDTNATGGNAAKEFVLFPEETSIFWTSDLNSRGRSQDVLRLTDDEKNGGLALDYDLPAGSGWAGAVRSAPLQDSAATLVVSLQGDPGATGFVMIEGSDEKRFGASFKLEDSTEKRLSLPLDRKTFGRALGKGDGILRFPLRNIGVFVTPDAASKGKLLASHFAYTSSKPAEEFPCLLSVAASHFDNVFFPSEDKTLEVVIRNRTTQARVSELAVRVTKDDGGEWSWSHKVEIPALATVRVPVKLDLPEPAFADCLFSLGKESETFRTTVSVVRPPQLSSIPFKDALYGLCTMAHPQTAKRIGARFFRVFFYWQWTEKSAGVYDFDKYIKDGQDCKDAGLGVIWTFEPNIPSWLGVKEMVLLNQPEPLQRFGEWVRAALKALPVGERAVEINNEPDITIGRTSLVTQDEAAAAAAALLKKGYEATKAVDPSIPVLGGGGSGEGTRILGFTQKMLRDAHGKVDYYSAHPYSGTRYITPDGSVMWPDQYLVEMLEKSVKVATEYTQGKALWSTELGWAYPMNDLYLSTSTKDYAAICAQTLVLFKVVPGVGKLAWFRGFQYKLGLNERSYDYSLFLQSYKGMRPTPGVNAFATVASLLEGAKTGEKLNLGPALNGYLFENPLTKQAVATIWTTRYDVSPKDRLPEGTTIIDLYGRDLRTDSELRLNRGPTFFVTSLAQSAALKSYLSKARWRPKQPFIITNIGSSQVNNLKLTVESFLLDDTAVDIKAGDAGTHTVLHPGVNKVTLTGTEKLFESNPLTIAVQISGVDIAVQGMLNKPVVPVPYLSTGSVLIDGALTAVKLKIAINTLDKRSDISPPDPSIPWEGAEDLSVRYGYAWNETGLYALYIVRDNKHVGVDGHDFWNYDSLQLAYDPQTKGGDSGYQPGHREIGLALDKTGKVRIVQTYPQKEDAPDVQAQVVRKDNDTVYEIFIPWAYFYGNGPIPAAHSILAANFIANDNDGSGRKCWMGPAEGIGSGKLPARFPWLHLLPPNATK
jgi:hypothetical protein